MHYAMMVYKGYRRLHVLADMLPVSVSSIICLEAVAKRERSLPLPGVESQSVLTTLWASTACYRGIFALLCFTLLYFPSQEHSLS
jgi:hypothetical protein